jgi:GAF domain-containing protein
VLRALPNLAAVPAPARLAALARSGLLDAPASETLDRIARLAAAQLQVPVVQVSVVTGEREQLAGSAGRDEPRDWALSEGLGGYVVAAVEPLVVEDARARPELREAGVVAYAGIPLLDVDGHALGVLAAIDSQPRAWSESELALLHDFGAIVEGELERRAAHQAAREVSALLLQLQRLSEATVTALDLDALLDAIVDACIDTFAADIAVLELFDDRGRLERRVERGLRDRDGRVALQLGAGFVDRIATSRQAIALPDLASADEPDAALLRDAGVRSLLAAPLVVDHRVRGAVYVGATQPGVFSELDRQLMAVSAERFAAAIVRAQRYERDRDVARTLVTALQPARLPDVPGVRLAGRYLPAERGLGGDWYDAFRLPGGALGVAIGDVVGHGVAAGVEAVRLRNALRGAVLAGCNVTETVLAMNAHAAAQPGAYASTLLYLELDARDRRLRWASAGHVPGVVAEEGRGGWLGEPGGPPLGVTDPDTWPGDERVLAPDARVVVFTDGLIERRTEPLDAGIERIAAIAARAPDLETLSDDAIAQAPEPRFDDLALIALELRA